MFWILLSFWETRKLDFLPPIRHFNERHACAAAATRVKYKIVHKKIIQIAAAGSLRLNTLWEGADTQVTVAKAEQ